MKISACLPVLLLAGVLTAAGAVPPAFAAGSNSLGRAKEIRWDLKKGKTVTLPVPFAAVGTCSLKAKVTKWTRKKNRDGSRSLEVKISVSQPLTFTRKQIHTIANSAFCRKYGRVSSPVYTAVLDYGTGLSLETKNRFGVTVTPAPDDGKVLKIRHFQDSHGCFLTLYDLQCHFTVHYPAAYQGLCIGIGSHTKLEQNSSKANRFFQGKLSFTKASMLYKASGRKTAHFIHIK